MMGRLLWAADKALFVVETGCALARQFVPMPTSEVPQVVCSFDGPLPAGLLRQVMDVTRPES